MRWLAEHWRNVGLLSLLVAFIGWEYWAHYDEHNIKANTLSDLTGQMEVKWPWTRLPVSAACLFLWWHLAYQEYHRHLGK